jgi:hypothetical protein
VPEPLAVWNPTRGTWETSRICLYGRSEPFSDPWPTSGTTRRGRAYERPTWALLTSDSESLSSPGLLGTPRTSSANGVGQYEESERGERGRLEAQVHSLLKTPNANLATNGGSQHPDKRKAGGHGPTLADEVEWLLPTLTTSQGGPEATPTRPSGAKGGTNLAGALLDGPMLPTPLARDHRTGYQQERKGRDSKGTPLNDAVVTLARMQEPSDPGSNGDATPEPFADGRLF